MPSLAQNALNDGVAELQTFGYDASTFRGVAVNAVINRLPQPQDPDASVNFTTHSGSTIWLPSTLLSPINGEVVTDSQGNKHRVTNVTFLVHAWQCDCETDS